MLAASQLLIFSIPENKENTKKNYKEDNKTD